MLLVSRVKCLSCNDEITSRYRHDFVTCKCGDVSLDGGIDYIKMSLKEGASYEDTSVRSNFDTDTKVTTHLKRVRSDLEYGLETAIHDTYNDGWNDCILEVASRLVKDGHKLIASGLLKQVTALRDHDINQFLNSEENKS